MKKEKNFVVYINPNWNGVAIFSKEESDEDCLYFTAWFHKPDFQKLYLLSCAADGEIEEDFIDVASDYLSEAEIEKIKAVAGDKKAAEEMIADFCSDYDRWDGGAPEESGIKNFDQFWELMQEEPGWFCIY